MRVLTIAILAILTVSCGRAERKEQIENCTQRGVEYYKEIGAYPALSDGRKAKDVAKEKCYLSRGAF